MATCHGPRAAEHAGPHVAVGRRVGGRKEPGGALQAAGWGWGVGRERRGVTVKAGHGRARIAQRFGEPAGAAAGIEHRGAGKAVALVEVEG